MLIRDALRKAYSKAYVEVGSNITINGRSATLTQYGTVRLVENWLAARWRSAGREGFVPGRNSDGFRSLT